MDEDASKFTDFMSRIEKMRANGGVDLSTAEDLSMAVMNLIALEEHFFFTAAKTHKYEYFDTAGEVREMRKDLLKQLMPEHEGETWCASKHLLSATMRLIEVGNKLQSESVKDGPDVSGSDRQALKERAHEMFEKAYRVYSIFWALKMKLIKIGKNYNSDKAGKEDKDFVSVDDEALAKNGQIGRIDDLVNQLANCCDE